MFGNRFLGMIVVGAILMSAMAVRAGQEIDAKQFGAVGNARNDDTTAIQKALDKAASAGGGTVFLAPGTYRLTGSLTVPGTVTLQGSWQAPHHSDEGFGSALFVEGGRGADETATATIEMQPSSCVRGLTFFHPAQDCAAVQSYPYVIRGRGMHCSVVDVTLVNAYRGIDFGTHWNELHYVRNVFGCVLKQGVYVNNCSDIGRIENVHFNPHYWFRCKLPESCPKADPQKIIDYMNANLDAFVFGRTDWEYVFNTFCFAFKTCYKFIQTPQGACNGNFLGIGADAGQFCVWVEAVQPMGVQITNGEFVAWPGDDSTQVVTTGSFGGTLHFNNCTFWGPSHRIARLEGPGHVSFSQCNFINCNKGPVTDSAWKVDCGTLQVANCRIAVDKNLHFDLGAESAGAIVTGNFINKKLAVEGPGKERAVVSQNVENAPAAPPARPRRAKNP